MSQQKCIVCNLCALASCNRHYSTINIIIVVYQNPKINKTHNWKLQQKIGGNI